MAGSVNKVILIGNVGKDPEIRTTQDGRKFANLRLATSEQWRDKTSGERKERTEWHSVVVFNDATAKFVEQYVRKGSKLYIEGQLQTRKWQDQQGQDRYSTEVVIQNFNGSVTLLDSKGASGGMEESGAGGYDAGGYGGSSPGGAGGYGAESRSGGAAPHANGNGGSKGFDKKLDDEIPF